MDLSGDLTKDGDEVEVEEGAEVEVEHRGVPEEHTLHFTYHPATMEATITKNRPTRAKTTTSKERRAQDINNDIHLI
jgi:hypothetical protein